MYYYVPYPHPYQKLGGLLKFFVVMAPIVLFFNIITQFSATSFWFAWSTYQTGEFWLRLVKQLCLIYSTVIQVTYAVMIIRRDPRFVRTWQLIYIGSALSMAMTIALHLVYGYPGNTSFAYGLAKDILSLAMVPAGLGLYTLYYAKSVRVRTYMGSDKYLRLAFFTRKARGPAPAVPDEVAY